LGTTETIYRDFFNKSCYLVKSNTTDPLVPKNLWLNKMFWFETPKYTESSKFIVIYHLARDSLIACTTLKHLQKTLIIVFQL